MPGCKLASQRAPNASSEGREGKKHLPAAPEKVVYLRLGGVVGQVPYVEACRFLDGGVVLLRDEEIRRVRDVSLPRDTTRERRGLSCSCGGDDVSDLRPGRHAPTARSTRPSAYFSGAERTAARAHPPTAPFEQSAQHVAC